MKGVLCFIGSVVWATVCSYLLWLFFWSVSPWLMRANVWGLIAYFLIGSAVLIGCAQMLSGLFVLPIVFMSKYCRAAAWFSLSVFAFNGYCAVAAPWHIWEGGVVAFLMAVSVSLHALSVFLNIMKCLLLMGLRKD